MMARPAVALEGWRALAEHVGPSAGVDPTPDQWKGILEVVQQRRLLPFFDSAYQVTCEINASDISWHRLHS